MKILVLGAGVIGTTSAWYLAQAGHEVTVIDRHDSAGMETSFANGGQISAGHAEPWAKPSVVPKNLDWDMYCGPSPLKPFVRERVGGTHRRYWDYDGGGLSDMGQHFTDPLQWTYGKDDTSPVEVEAHAPPAHPEVTGMWGWVEIKYADGFTFVFDSGEWGKAYDRREQRRVSLDDLSEDNRKKLLALSDPEPLMGFGDAVKERKRAGGHAEAAHRTVTIIHLANIAIRIGRKIRFDPVAEVIVGDEEANRLVNPPLRAPWHV